MTKTTEKTIPFGYAKRHGVLITAINDDCANIGYLGKLEPIILNELKRTLQLPLKLTKLNKEEFATQLAKYYESTASTTMQAIIGMEENTDLQQLIKQIPKSEELLDTDDDAPIIRLINALFTQAIKQNASDIHIETFEERVSVRFRVDGVLHEVLEPPHALAPLLVSRIKVMAKLDIAEKRLPQDGRITIRIANRPIDVRVSTLPSSHGERVVLRLLDKRAAKLDLTSLGMPIDDLTKMRALIRRPNGIILVTGPTGSGKTTSLYAALTELNEATRNILTVEDPIEYYLPGIGQTQVNPKVKMTFARGLRSILRQDPDVIMVGEIRDLETAEISVQASLTGHLVLSTLHTNSAIGAITRLRDMGVEPFLLASTVIGVTAQRLVRILCKQCRAAKPATKSECEILNIPYEQAPTLYHHVGCKQCNHTGFAGRTGIYEVIAIDEQLKNMIHENKSEPEMENYAHKSSTSMRQDGFKKVLTGETTLEEILRVTASN